MTNRMTAFTLIEMLVVISIMVVLSSMIFITLERNFDDVLTADAINLQTTLDRARALAMSTGNVHGVAFHLENAGDGSVLKNKSVLDDANELFIGRHWYCIIGPDPAAIGNVTGWNVQGFPPLRRVYWNSTCSHPALMDYVEAVEKSQVGPRQYLSEGVRFLALSDSDRIFHHKVNSSGSDSIIGGGHPNHVPERPWYGWYNKADKTLYPWGGYNRDLDKMLGGPNTALDYAGLDGEIPYDPDLDTNISPNEVWGNIKFVYDYDASSTSSAVYTGATARWAADVGAEDKINNTHYKRTTITQIGPDTEVLAGKKRPVLNAHWLDFMIYFQPNGEAQITRGHIRSQLMNAAAHNRSRTGRAQMGMVFKDDDVAGYTFTLCRDVDPEADADLYTQTNPITGQPAYNKFETVEDAFKSITPFLRVYVHKLSGKTAIRSNAHPLHQITADDLLQSDPYPRLRD